MALGIALKYMYHDLVVERKWYSSCSDRVLDLKSTIALLKTVFV